MSAHDNCTLLKYKINSLKLQSNLEILKGKAVKVTFVVDIYKVGYNEGSLNYEA